MLTQLIDQLAIPTTPPDVSRADEAIGLALLDLALRMEHVSRITENLTVVDEGSMRRVLSIDVDCKGIDPEQRTILRVRSTGHSSRGEDLLWIPVMRHNKEDLAPVVVKDSSGDVTARLTHRAATAATVAGLTRLLKLMLTQDVVARARSAAPQDITWTRATEERARWLLLNCVREMIERGVEPASTIAAPDGGSNGGEREERDAIRRAATELWNAVEQREPFLDLLTVAANEYWLIVALPEAERHHHLSFEAPLLRDRAAPISKLRRWTRRFVGLRECTVQYVTEIPRSISSYHVTVEVPEELKVRRFILSSNADEESVVEVLQDIEALRTFVSERVPDDADPDEDAAAAHRHRAIQELVAQELSSVVSKVETIVDRRMTEARRYRTYLELDRSFDQTAPLVQDLTGLSGGPLAGVDEPITGANKEEVLSLLCRQATALEGNAMGDDVIVENDPRENGAHAQWRQAPLPFSRPSLAPMKATVWLTLSDEEPALVDSVRRMLHALIAVVVGISAAILLPLTSLADWTEGLLPRLFMIELGASGDVEPQAPPSDAIVAVLLIVPGILLSRLDIPKTNSVLDLVRRLPQTVAYAALCVTSGLAVLIAPSMSPSLDLAAAAVAICLLVSLQLPLLVAERRRGSDRVRPIPDVASVPEWLRAALDPSSGHRRDSRPAPHAVFRAVDLVEHHATGGSTSSSASSRMALGSAQRRAAELASTGSRAARGASSSIEFTLEQRSRSAQPAARSPRPPHGRTPGCLAATGEVLHISAMGSSVELVAEPQRRRRSEAQTGATWVSTQDGEPAWVFRDVMDMHPVPLIGNAPSVDVLVSLPRGATPAALLTTLLGEGTAVQKCRLRSLHYPESGMRGTVGDDSDRRRTPADECMRLSLALPESADATSRVSLLADVVDACLEHGAGLHVGTAHAYARPFEWHQVIKQPSRTVPRPRLSGLSITLIGPPGRGGLGHVQAMSRCLTSEAVRERFELRTASVLVSQHFSFATLHVEATAAAAKRLSRSPAFHVDSDARRVLLDAFGGDADLAAVLDSNYRLAVGETGLRTPVEIGEAGLWVLWEGPALVGPRADAVQPGAFGGDAGGVVTTVHDHSETDIFELVLDELEARKAAPTVLYKRARFLPGGRVSGRAKIGVRLTDDDSHHRQDLTDLAKRTQDDVEHECITRDLQRHAFRVKVMTREWWL